MLNRKMCATCTFWDIRYGMEPCVGDVIHLDDFSAECLRYPPTGYPPTQPSFGYAERCGEWSDRTSEEVAEIRAYFRDRGPKDWRRARRQKAIAVSDELLRQVARRKA